MTINVFFTKKGQYSTDFVLTIAENAEKHPKYSPLPMFGPFGGPSLRLVYNSRQKVLTYAAVRGRRASPSYHICRICEKAETLSQSYTGYSFYVAFRGAAQGASRGPRPAAYCLFIVMHGGIYRVYITGGLNSFSNLLVARSSVRIIQIPARPVGRNPDEGVASAHGCSITSDRFEDNLLLNGDVE